VSAPRRCGDERGAIGLTTVMAVMGVLTVLLTTLGAAVEVARASIRAQTAADAAALAAMAASPLVGRTAQSGCAEASRLARANGAQLLSCRGPRAGAWLDDAEVEVGVALSGSLSRRLVPGVTARARAALRPVDGPGPPHTGPGAGGGRRADRTDPRPRTGGS
jgi:hypothetical protein